MSRRYLKFVVDNLSRLWLNQDMTTKRLYTAEDFDAEGGSFVARHWLTTEADARRYFAKFTNAARLIGPTGLILATR